MYLLVLFCTVVMSAGHCADGFATSVVLTGHGAGPLQLSARSRGGDVDALASRTDTSGALQHSLYALDRDRTTPVEECAERFALVLVNYKLSRPLLETLWFNASVRVCADGAINRLYRLFDDDETRSRFIPEYIRGDLDSVETDIRNYYDKKGTIIVRDSDQDTNDLEKCIALLQTLDLNINQVLVMGAFGGRIDHEFSHYFVVYKFPHINIVLISTKRVAFLLREGTHHIVDRHAGPMCGLIPLGPTCRSVTTTGLQWDVNNAEMSFTGLISTSNRMTASCVTVKTSHSLLWVSDVKDAPGKKSE